LPFCADASEHHAAALWLRAGDWAAAREAVELIEAWRRIPAPLAWMAEARYRTEGLEAAWPLLTELACCRHGALPTCSSASPMLRWMRYIGDSMRNSTVRAVSPISRSFRRGC